METLICEQILNFSNNITKYIHRQGFIQALLLRSVFELNIEFLWPKITAFTAGESVRALRVPNVDISPHPLPGSSGYFSHLRSLKPPTFEVICHLGLFRPSGVLCKKLYALHHKNPKCKPLLPGINPRCTTLT